MLKTFSLTDIGKKRTMNQDFIYTSEEPVGNLPNLFIVADGMGGHNGGGYASSYATEVASKTVLASKDSTPRKIFASALEMANKEVRKKAMESSELEGMGTTMVLATVIGDVLQVANVGDSRLYVIGNDSIRQITVDHSYVEEMIKVGTLDRESARNHPQKNIITRAVGAEDEIIPDFFTVRLREDEIVLMCTDGLTNMVSDEDILTIVKKERDIAGKAEALVNAANDNGGKDNVAVVLVAPFMK